MSINFNAKVGDRVRFVEDLRFFDDDSNPPRKGTLGTIVQVDEDDDYYTYLVLTDDGAKDWPRNEAIELTPTVTEAHSEQWGVRYLKAEPSILEPGGLFVYISSEGGANFGSIHLSADQTADLQLVIANLRKPDPWDGLSAEEAYKKGLEAR